MQNPSKDSYGIIILAAGNSSRLGQPKQLLMYQNKTLIRHILDEAIEITGTNVVVVLGADAELVRAELKDAAINVVENPKWQQGMASSIRTGLSAMQELNSSLEGIILAVCDQPFVSADIFKELITLKETTDRHIVACSYDNTAGTPALFSKNYFSALMSLNGSEGAKKLLMQHNEDLITIPFPDGGIDIDTVEDYNRLSKQTR
jgi:molybdenum cofactor cytidylyltransferase